MLKRFRRAPAAVAAEAGPLSFTRPWARIGMPAGDVVGGYFTVANRGGEDDRLVSAASAAAGKVEIHAIKVVGPDLRVGPLPEGLAVPGDTALELKPRGYHLQLTGLRQRPAVGTDLPVVLSFAKAGRVELSLRIQDEGPVGSDTL